MAAPGDGASGARSAGCVDTGITGPECGFREVSLACTPTASWRSAERNFEASHRKM